MSYRNLGAQTLSRIDALSITELIMIPEYLAKGPPGPGGHNNLSGSPLPGILIVILLSDL